MPQVLLKAGCSKGFTLIELLVVLIIVGVLTAIALPNLLAQVGRARETELKNAVGTVNRSQQAYHWEHAVFAPNQSALLANVAPGNTIDTVTITPVGGVDADPNWATVVITNNEALDDRTRGYSGGVYYSNGTYQLVVCQNNAVSVNGIPPVNSGGSLSCDTGSTRLK